MTVGAPGPGRAGVGAEGGGHQGGAGGLHVTTVADPPVPEAAQQEAELPALLGTPRHAEVPRLGGLAGEQGPPRVVVTPKDVTCQVAGGQVVR